MSGSRQLIASILAASLFSLAGAVPCSAEDAAVVADAIVKDEAAAKEVVTAVNGTGANDVEIRNADARNVQYIECAIALRAASAACRIWTSVSSTRRSASD